MSRNLTAIRESLERTIPGGEKITGVKAFSTGHSNETYLIEGLDQILRLPPSVDPLMPDSHSVPLQAAIYQALEGFADAPPVPHIIYRHDDPALLGDPFFVMARADGEEVNDYNPQPWFKDASLSSRGSMSEIWMKAFTGIANLPVLDVLGDTMTSEDEARRWRTTAENANCVRLVEQFDRLLETAPSRTGAPSPVHGDPKLANLMWADGKMTVLLDWELAFNGEPLADLGYMLFFFESDEHPANGACTFPGMWKREQVICHWSEATGRSADGVEWHETAAMVKMAAIIAHGYNLYASGKSDDVRFLRWKDTLEKNMKIIDTMFAKL